MPSNVKGRNWVWLRRSLMLECLGYRDVVGGALKRPAPEPGRSEAPARIFHQVGGSTTHAGTSCLERGNRALVSKSRVTGTWTWFLTFTDATGGTMRFQSAGGRSGATSRLRIER